MIENLEWTQNNAQQNLEQCGPQGFWGSGENDYLFSGSWGALVIIFR